MKKGFDKVIENWITSLIGGVIMLFTTYKAYINFDDLDISKVIVIVIMITLGLVLLKSKDKILLNIFKSKLDK